MLEMMSSDVNSIIKSSSETDKLSSQLGKYRIFFNQLGIGLFNWVFTFFYTQVIISNWVFCQGKLLLVNNLRSNNFLCLSASIFVFLTLIVSTQARHSNTWLKCQCVSLLLAYFTAERRLFFDFC